MPTRRIADVPDRCASPRPCTHPDHGPPTMMVYEPGVYEHICPRCGAVHVFTVEERPGLGTVLPPWTLTRKRGEPMWNDSPETWARKTMAAGPPLPSLVRAARIIREGVRRHGSQVVSRRPMR